MNSRFLISQAAKKYNISRSTLLYYDSIDLLEPSYDHENGYRYYTSRELEKLELILTLKESGLSLKAIKSFLDNPSHEKSANLLSKQKDEISRKIQDLQKLEIILDKRISLLNEYQKVEFYEDIRLDYYPEMTVCKVDLNYQVSNPYEDAIFSLKDALDTSVTSYGSITSKYGLCIDLKRLLNNYSYPYKYVFDYLSEHVESVDSLKFPSSYYVRCIHLGSYNIIQNTLKKLLNFIQQHNYSISGDVFLIPLVDLWSASSEDDYKSELLIPIELE